MWNGRSGMEAMYTKESARHMRNMLERDKSFFGNGGYESLDTRDTGYRVWQQQWKTYTWQLKNTYFGEHNQGLKTAPCCKRGRKIVWICSAALFFHARLWFFAHCQLHDRIPPCDYAQPASWLFNIPVSLHSLRGLWAQRENCPKARPTQTPWQFGAWEVLAPTQRGRCRQPRSSAQLNSAAKVQKSQHIFLTRGFSHASSCSNHRAFLRISPGCPAFFPASWRCLALIQDPRP